MQKSSLKSSFLIILIQVVGILLSLLSVYFVAGDMGPEIYSLKGIHGVIGGVIVAFSHLGVETTMMREALYWKEKGDVEKVKEYATQSIVSRFIGFVVLSPFVIAYLTFICFSKYNGDYSLLLFLFFIGSCIGALNDSMSLIIRSEGGYVFSQFVRTLNTEVIGAIGIILYLKAGAQAYLYFLAFAPIPVLLIFFFKINNLFSLKYAKIKPTLRKIKESKYLWLRSYLDYFKGNADTLLVSILFPPAIIGAYTIYKTLENMVKSFIEGFFDVISQRTVKFKGQLDKLLKEERKFNFIRWAAIAIIVVAGIVFSLDADFFINVVNLSKYGSMELIVYTVLAVAIIYLIGKYEINAVSLFATSKATFNIGIVVFGITIASYLSLVLLSSIEGALLQRIIAWSGTSLISILYFRANRTKLYTQINR